MRITRLIGASLLVVASLVIAGCGGSDICGDAFIRDYNSIASDLAIGQDAINKLDKKCKDFISAHGDKKCRASSTGAKNKEASFADLKSKCDEAAEKAK